MHTDNNETVLVVDDTPANLQVMTHFLTRAGLRVLIAEDGTTAVELASTQRPDLVLLDVTMPDLDGYETCRLLKSDPDTHQIPVIFMTARTELQDKVEGFQAGAVDYITKPYQEPEVLARISAHLTLARQKRELAALLAERERFMRIAAHDLRNPLACITTWSDFAINDERAAPVAKMLQHIHKSANQMRGIIEDFLQLRVLESETTGGVGPIELRPLIEQVMEQQAGAAQLKNMSLFCPSFDEGAHARGHLGHCHQILTNYVSNAIKYSPPGTAIRIGVEPREPYTRILVQDHGPGVAADERDRLFVEFGKISNKPTGGETSTKLGLAIVKRLAEHQGGTVGAEFPAEGGSIFWFEIPRSHEPPA